jgi:hypothetical protein
MEDNPVLTKFFMLQGKIKPEQPKQNKKSSMVSDVNLVQMSTINKIIENKPKNSFVCKYLQARVDELNDEDLN